MALCDGPAPRGTRGFTLIEMMIVIVLLVIMSGLMYETTLRTMEATEYAQIFNIMAIKAQRLSNALKEDLVTTKRLFEDGTDVGYFNALSLTPPPIDTTKLPKIEENDHFCADSAAMTKTGNCLMFVKVEPAYSVEAAYKVDGLGDPVTRPVRVDLYRAVIYYLARPTNYQGRSPLSQMAGGINLIRWQSVRFADKGQIDALEIRDPTPADAESLQSNVIASLSDPADPDPADPTDRPVGWAPIEYCWDPTKPVDEAFFKFVEVGGVHGMQDTTGDGVPDPVPGMSIEPAQDVNQWKDQELFDATAVLVDSDDSVGVSVSWNARHPALSALNILSTQLPRKSPVLVPKFAIPIVDTTTDWFPNGLEVQVIGQSGYRQTLVRLVLTKETTRQRIVAHESTTIVSTRDF